MSEEPISKRPQTNKMLLGIVAASIVAAFLAGYSLGDRPAEPSNIITITDAVPVQVRPQPSPVFVSIDDDPMKGSPDAKVTIIEFSDFQCPFCARFYKETLPLIERDYINTGKVNFVYRDMPLDIHANAIPAHKAAECAHVQGLFWQYHDVLFDRMDEWAELSMPDLEKRLISYSEELGLDSSFAACMKSADIDREVQKDYRQATGYGATSTPTFFIGNDESGYTKLAGAKPYVEFRQIIDSKLG